MPNHYKQQMNMPKGGGKGGAGAPQPNQKKSLLNNFLTTVLIFLVLISVYSIVAEQRQDTEDITISELVVDVNEGAVSKIVVSGEELEITYSDGTVKESQKEAGTALSQTLVNYGVPLSEVENLSIDVQRESSLGYWLITFSPVLISLLFIIIFIWFITRQVRGTGMQAFSFGQSKARLISPHDKNQQVKFKDVAGVKEAKEELKEVVDFLKNPKKFLEIGARIPKGALLIGAPGAGKTLLARAVAGEAGVPFFSISGSEFIEMFVGVGSARVRDMFRVAKQAAPAIIFIDELDAIGRVRGGGMGGGNDEREQTLNQILVEMDGFDPNEKIVVMGATNRPDVLDPALLRPGRFDRRIVVDLPDKEDRLQILKVHANKKPFEDDADLKVVAERTPGFSGADLYSLMNEAAIRTARQNRKKISHDDLLSSIEKVMLGPERRSHLLSGREKEITAYHEAGHAIISSVLPFADPVHKITVVSRGRAAGYTLKLPIEEKRLQSRREFHDEIATSLGGYVAERMIFDDLTTGASNDLQVSSGLARDMVTKYGMSDKLGPVAYEPSSGKSPYKIESDRVYSEQTGSHIDEEVENIMKSALARAEEVLTTHRDAMEAVAKKLIDVETLERDAYEAILEQYNIEVQERPKGKTEVDDESKEELSDES